jgi:hypothetical protein
VVVEVNSLVFHSTPSDQHADEERYAELVTAGYTVVVVWEDALWSNTPSVVAAVALGRRHARGGDPVIIHTVGCPWPAAPDRIVVGASTRRYRG